MKGREKGNVHVTKEVVEDVQGGSVGAKRTVCLANLLARVFGVNVEVTGEGVKLSDVGGVEGGSEAKKSRGEKK